MVAQQNEWSTEWPTEPGWYWMLGGRGSVAYPTFVRDGKFCVDGVWREGDSLRVAWLRIDPPDLDGARRALRGGLGAVTGMDPFKAAGVRPVRTQPGTGTPPKRDSD